MNAENQVNWGEQDEYGNDIAMMRYNLTLTPDQRYEQHQKALRFALLCMEAAENARISRSPEST